MAADWELEIVKNQCKILQPLTELKVRLTTLDTMWLNKTISYTARKRLRRAAYEIVQRQWAQIGKTDADA